MKKSHVAIVLVALLAGVGLGLLLFDDDDAPATTAGWIPPDPTGESVAAGLESYYEQDLGWEECGRNQCTWVTVPVDYDDPAGETTRLRVSVVPADGEGGRSLFVNPGGPGGSAIEFADQFAALVGDDVQQVYDVVGMDPRGVGESTPLECFDGARFDDYVAQDPTPDDPEEQARYVQEISELAAACEQNSGALAAHVSTVEVARDLDVVRALLGEEKLDWFGASYGTQLGATYATLFPERTGRMVLDGAVDPTLDAFESAMAQTTGFQRAVESYAAWCAEQGDCPLGDDPAVGVDRLTSFLAALDVRPLPGLGDRLLTEGIAFYGVALPLYNEGSWDFLSQALELALDGDGSGLMYASDLYFDRQDDGSYGSNLGQVITAVSCLDSTDRPELDDVFAQVDRFEQASPIFGRALAWGAAGCSAWPFTSDDPAPQLDGAGAPPILVLGTTRDPATPYESAVALAEQLESGMLITRDGDGHTAYTSGNQCIADTVDRFLLDGTVPEADPRC
ncbi:TAP-like protein [Aeromicrobium marinum DSM 15272]|uniref:TAP-like protein n=1 Tax=Aeromicrobium marinum DSM 15272 TaxID=585531 RepID=E2SFJ6_9ACTN|nr:alpha/beta hydrolase [Aeromicrobium marinum]EFQ82097.1 TAP-like protein [Aeromicrobium marinum DSM 15272]